MATLCRLCTAEDESFTHLSEIHDGFPLSVITMIICPVKIESSDLLPQQICQECVETVLSAYKLRDVSNNTERYLRSINVTDDEPAKIDSGEITIVDMSDADRLSKETESTTEIIIEEGEEMIVREDYTDYVEDSLEQSSYVDTNSELDPNFKYRVNCLNNHTKKSAVWNYFGCLVDENDKIVEEEKDFYFCQICVEQNQALKPKYKAESTATSVLFSHLSRVHGLQKSDMSENPSFTLSHHAPELVSCEVCEKTFNSNSLDIHMGIEHYNGAFRRDCVKNSHYKVNCFKTSSKSLAWDYFGALENESDEQIDQYYFYCRLCVEEDGRLNPKYTKNTSTSILLQHLKNAHIPKTSEEIAKRKLPEPIVLISSKRTKNNDFSCKYCGENFDAKKSLNRHLAKEHNEEEPRNFTCESCLKSFTMRDTLLKHIKNIHQGLKHHCNRCPAVLSSQMSLRRHVESCHFKIKSFGCDLCSAVYTEQKSLKKHMQKVHMGIVDKKIPCEFCDLMFTNQWSLRRHHRTHTGEKPHKCNLCSLSYASKGDLTKHLTNVHNIAVYKCEYSDCTAGFRLRNDLRDHYNKVHYQNDQEENEEYEVFTEEFVG